MKCSLFLCVVAWFFSPFCVSAKERVIHLGNIAVTDSAAHHATDKPSVVLNGRELSLKRASTLGETLNGTPGVSATQFGPNASRPVIRGLEGERVRIMQNGVGVLDASSLSADHAVGVDPLVIEQIEVVRGPAALLYGGNAAGGVVNAVDHRIPKEPLSGVLGRAEVRLGGADNTNNGALVLDAGNEKWAVHFDAYSRKTSDVAIPTAAVSRQKSEQDNTPRVYTGRLANSRASGNGGALGAALTFDDGYLGASFSTLNNDYGVVAEERVRIAMKSERWDVASEWRNLSDAIHRVQLRAVYTDYQHQEIEDGVVGTSFKNKGLEGSMELDHALPWGLNGVTGLRLQHSQFAALGDEAFVPKVSTQSQALYTLASLPIHQHHLTFSGRVENAELSSSTDEKFGAGQSRRFTPVSLALGGVYQMNEAWSITSNLSHNERAPSYFELYANGPHLATQQFEVGNAQLKQERANGLEVQLKWQQAHHQAHLSAYYTRFSNYIGAFDTGDVDPATRLPIATLNAVPAVFKGLEFAGDFALNEQLQLHLKGDYIHAKNQLNNRYMPRISPIRLGVGIHYQQGNVGVRLDALHAFTQHHLAPNALATDGYTDISAMLIYKLPSRFNVELFAKASNLLNDEIRDHTSALKEVSLAGERSLTIGARADF